MTISPKRLAEIEAIRDDQIDYSDLPEMDETFYKTARLAAPGQLSTWPAHKDFQNIGVSLGRVDEKQKMTF